MAAAAEPGTCTTSAACCNLLGETSDYPLYPLREVSLDEVHVGSEVIDLNILNRYERRPQNIQDFFIAARASLSAAPRATFAANPAILQACRENGIHHLGGPMLGNLSDQGASVWVRTTKPASVRVIVQTEDGASIYGPVKSTVESDLTAIVEINNLAPDSEYPYKVTVDDQPLAVPHSARIRTYPSTDSASRVKIAFGSCLHKRGFGNHTLFNLVRKRGNAAMLIYGDLAVDDRNNHLGLHRSDYLLRDLSPAWQDFSASVPVYATWDDHDYFDNDLGGIPSGFTGADRRSVRKIWTQNWNNPSYGFTESEEGVFFRTRIGPADVIMLDTRYFREGDPSREDNKTSFIGEAQMQWLEQQLLDCKGPFIILTSGTMWSDYISSGKDSWGVWDKSGRERVLSFIETHRIPGVLLLSGDRHGARGFRIPRPSGHIFYEFEPASLGGLFGPPVFAEDCPEQLFGYESIRAFGELEFDTTLPDPEATFRLVQSDGIELYQIKLSLSQLTPPGVSRK